MIRRILCLAMLTALPGALHAQTASVVTSVAARWNPSTAWTISSRPAITLGLEDGPQHLLFQRIVGVFVVGENVLVADAGSRSIRLLAPNGRLIAQHGRDGEGPGEMRDLTRVWLNSDGSPTVYDGRLRRLTTFRSSRPQISSLSTPAITAGPHGQMEDGVLVMAAPRRLRLGGALGDILMDTVTVWVGTDTHRQVEHMKGASRMVVGTAEWARYPFLPLTVFPSVSVGRDWFVVGDGLSPELRYYNSSGQLQRVVRWNPPRRRVTDAVRREVVQMIADSEPPAERRVWQRFATDAPYPEMLPVFDKILLDTSRVTWIRQFEYRRAQPERWTAFDAQGSWLGTLTFPSGFSVTEFGLRHVAGVHRDGLGVQRAAVFSLTRK